LKISQEKITVSPTETGDAAKKVAEKIEEIHFLEGETMVARKDERGRTVEGYNGWLWKREYNNNINKLGLGEWALFSFYLI